jgi:hypothetical protein
MEQNTIGFPNSMYPHVVPYTSYFHSSYGGIGSVPTMWPSMSNPLANPTAPPKPVLGITQDEIITNHKELFGEDDDFFERKHNLRMPRIILTKRPYHGRKSRPS